MQLTKFSLFFSVVKQGVRILFIRTNDWHVIRVLETIIKYRVQGTIKHKKGMYGVGRRIAKGRNKTRDEVYNGYIRTLLYLCMYT